MSTETSITAFYVSLPYRRDKRHVNRLSHEGKTTSDIHPTFQFHHFPLTGWNWDWGAKASETASKPQLGWKCSAKLFPAQQAAIKMIKHSWCFIVSPCLMTNITDFLASLSLTNQPHVDGMIITMEKAFSQLTDFAHTIFRKLEQQAFSAMLESLSPGKSADGNGKALLTKILCLSRQLSIWVVPDCE